MNSRHAQIAAILHGVGRVKSSQNRRSEIGSEMRRLSRVAPDGGHAVPDHSCAMLNGTREGAP